MVCETSMQIAFSFKLVTRHLMRQNQSAPARAVSRNSTFSHQTLCAAQFSVHSNSLIIVTCDYLRGCIVQASPSFGFHCFDSAMLLGASVYPAFFRILMREL